MDKRNDEIRKVEVDRRNNEKEALMFQNEHLEKFLQPLHVDTKAIIDKLRNPVVENQQDANQVQERQKTEE